MREPSLRRSILSGVLRWKVSTDLLELEWSGVSRSWDFSDYERIPYGHPLPVSLELLPIELVMQQLNWLIGAMTSAWGNRIDGRHCCELSNKTWPDSNPKSHSQTRGWRLFILKRLLRLPRV
jgi:hypothetical protein